MTVSEFKSASIVDILKEYPTWDVYDDLDNNQGTITFSIDNDENISFMVSSSDVFAQYLSTQFEPNLKVFQADKTYHIDKFRINDKVFGKIKEFSGDFYRCEVSIEKDSNQDLLLTLQRVSMHSISHNVTLSCPKASKIYRCEMEETERKYFYTLKMINNYQSNN